MERRNDRLGRAGFARTAPCGITLLLLGHILVCGVHSGDARRRLKGHSEEHDRPERAGVRFLGNRGHASCDFNCHAVPREKGRATHDRALARVCERRLGQLRARGRGEHAIFRRPVAGRWPPSPATPMPLTLAVTANSPRRSETRSGCRCTRPAMRRRGLGRITLRRPTAERTFHRGKLRIRCSRESGHRPLCTRRRNPPVRLCCIDGSSDRRPARRHTPPCLPHRGHQASPTASKPGIRQRWKHTLYSGSPPMSCTVVRPRASAQRTWSLPR